MKKAIFIVIILVGHFSIKAQSTAIKTKTFYWGEGNFHQAFTESGKKMFDSVFKFVSIDTINCIKITPDQEVAYLSKDYLSKCNYRYLTIYKYDDIISVRKYDNIVYSGVRDKKKILLKYSKDFNNKIDRVSLHVID